jgi:transcriptional regulator with XRE-family HTH domain
MKILESFSDESRTFGERIKTLRSDNQMTQGKFRAVTTLTQSQISLIETGKSNFTFETIVKLAIGLQVEIAYLFDYENNNGTVIKKVSLAFDKRLRSEKIKFGTRIMKLCSHRKQKQDELAILANIDPGDLSRYINGDKNIEFYTIYRIALALEVLLFDLFDYNGPLPDNSKFKGKLKE